jgi:protein-tyrosine phosphatase
MTPQVLIPGTYNSRDLGGLAAKGGTVRPNTMVRSDAPVKLGAEGRSAVRGLGIRTAIDLRQPIERKLDPADLDGLGVDLHQCSVIAEGYQLDRDVSLAQVYRYIVDERGAQLTSVVRLLATPGTLPALVFCSAGKDRTGLVTALTLAAAGVSDEAIIADYAQTERNMHGEFREMLSRRARAAGISEQELAVKVGAPPALMRETLQWLREHHGGPRELLAGHGMTNAEFDRLRGALLAPRAAQAA